VRDENLEIYLRPTFTIDCDHEYVVERARDLTRTCTSDSEKAIKLFYFVRDSIKFNIYMISAFEEDHKASRVLQWGEAYCIQKAILLTALGRAAGIPSRLIFARIRNHQLPPEILEWKKDNIFNWHGYNQFYINDRWISVAATFDRRLCDKVGLPVVEFDGLTDALLPKRDLRGEPFIDYIETLGQYPDFPIEGIRKEVSKYFGNQKRPWPKAKCDAHLS